MVVIIYDVYYNVYIISEATFEQWLRTRSNQQQGTTNSLVYQPSIIVVYTIVMIRTCSFRIWHDSTTV